MTALLHRIARAARLRHHQIAEHQTRRLLASATGEDFDVVRDRLFELEWCLSPGECDCLGLKPLRRIISA